MPLLALLAVMAAPGGGPGEALPLLRAACRGAAAEPGSAWGLAHGLKAFGPSLRAPGGHPAAEVLVDELLAGPAPRAGAPGVPERPPGTLAARRPASPSMPPGAGPGLHPGLLLKALVVDARLPLDAPLPGPAGPVTLRALAERAPWPFPAAPGPEAWRELAWTLDVLGQSRRPGEVVPGADGQPVEVDRLFDQALAQLEADDEELARGLAGGLPEVPKHHQGIYAHPCGGLHLVQAVLSWARHPSVRERWGGRVDAQLRVLLYRAGSEERQLAAARALARRDAPALEGAVLAQGLKFRGHFLETVARLRRELGWTPGPAGERMVAATAAALRAEVEGPLRPALLARAPPGAAADELGGDACHAVRGLEGR